MTSSFSVAQVVVHREDAVQIFHGPPLLSDSDASDGVRDAGAVRIWSANQAANVLSFIVRLQAPKVTPPSPPPTFCF